MNVTYCAENTTHNLWEAVPTSAKAQGMAGDIGLGEASFRSTKWSN